MVIHYGSPKAWKLYNLLELLGSMTKKIKQIISRQHCSSTYPQKIIIFHDTKSIKTPRLARYVLYIFLTPADPLNAGFCLEGYLEHVRMGFSSFFCMFYLQLINRNCAKEK